MGKSKIDDELTELLTKLYTMQEDVGAKPKSSDEEKKFKAENIAVMGTGRKAQAKGSRFLELRSMIIQRIKTIHRKLSEVKDLENAGYGGDNPTQLIKLQAEIREEIRQANDEWKELDAIYKREARKKRSKFTPEELETQAQLVQQLYEQIEKVREAQMAGFARAGRPDHDAAASILGGGIKQYGRYWIWDMGYTIHRSNTNSLMTYFCWLGLIHRRHWLWRRVEWRRWWRRWWRRRGIDRAPTRPNPRTRTARC